MPEKLPIRRTFQTVNSHQPLPVMRFIPVPGGTNARDHCTIRETVKNLTFCCSSAVSIGE